MSNTRKIKKKITDCNLVNYRYSGDKAIGTYIQDEAPVLKQCAIDRDNTPGKFERYDLDMGFKFASIPKVIWLHIQRLGIENDMKAIIQFLQTMKATTGKDYFTTTKCLG